jgi:hypothetical protein
MEREKNDLLNLWCCVNITIKKKVSIEESKENIYDGKVLKELVGYVISKNDNIQKVLTAEPYDSKDNFKYHDELKIAPVIKVRKIHHLKIITIAY